ncbi:MAG TPA: hypothetical protein VFA52_01240 [Candidatus Paceibacterota bacterium]|nr:hypothetical protein [Candidatus Paceibacterota bacterium]
MKKSKSKKAKDPIAAKIGTVLAKRVRNGMVHLRKHKIFSQSPDFEKKPLSFFHLRSRAEAIRLGLQGRNNRENRVLYSFWDSYFQEKFKKRKA